MFKRYKYFEELKQVAKEEKKTSNRRKIFPVTIIEHKEEIYEIEEKEGNEDNV